MGLFDMFSKKPTPQPKPQQMSLAAFAFTYVQERQPNLPPAESAKKVMALQQELIDFIATVSMKGMKPDQIKEYNDLKASGGDQLSYLAQFHQPPVVFEAMQQSLMDSYNNRPR